VRVGFGPVFKGYNGRVDPSAMDRAETDQMCGVFCSEGGILKAPGLVRVNSYGLGSALCASFDGSHWIKVVNGTDTWHEFGSKWTVLGAFNPTTISGEHFIFSKRVEISASDYYAPALSIQSDGTLKLYWTDSNGDDHSITSTNTVSTGTTYLFLAVRLDDALYLYVGTLTTTPTEWASTTGLGAADYPEDEATNDFWLASDPDEAHGLIGKLDSPTVYDFAIQETGVAVLACPQPRLRTCLLHMGLNEAAGSEFEDHSRFSYTITHAAGVTHEEEGLILTPTIVNMLGETRVPGDRVYANAIVAGLLYASRLNA